MTIKFCTITLSIQGLFKILSIHDTRLIKTLSKKQDQNAECQYAECEVLFVVMLSVVILRVVAPLTTLHSKVKHLGQYSHIIFLPT